MYIHRCAHSRYSVNDQIPTDILKGWLARTKALLLMQTQTHGHTKIDLFTHIHKFTIIPSDRWRTRNALKKISLHPGSPLPPFPDKAMDIPGITTSINPDSTKRQTNPTTSSNTGGSSVSQEQRVRLHEEKKRGQRVKGTSHYLPWESSGGKGTGTQDLPSRLFLLPPLACPMAGGRVTIHEICVQTNASHSYQGQRHSLPMTGRAVLKGKPIAKSEGNRQYRKQETASSKMVGFWTAPSHCPGKFRTAFLPWTICNRLLTLPLQSVFHRKLRRFSVTQIWHFPVLPKGLSWQVDFCLHLQPYAHKCLFIPLIYFSSSDIP